MAAFKAMLFDLDGTLLDSAADLVASLNWVRRGVGLEPVPVKEVAHHASRGAIGLLEGGMPATDADTFEDWRQQFIAHYARHSYVQSRLYEGIQALLDHLDAKGIPWGVVTNKIEALTLPIIEAANLSDSISCCVCGDTLSERKPHPAPVSLACDLLGTAPEDTVFAGDDLRDIQAGKAAGTGTAAVLYGYGSWQLQGDAVNGSFPIRSPADLYRLVP